LTEQRYYSAWYPSPFPKESHKLLVAGGYGGAGVIFYLISTSTGLGRRTNADKYNIIEGD